MHLQRLTLSAEYTAKLADLWLEGASKGFTRIPYWLIWYHSELGLTHTEFVAVCWISLHQRSAKAAFPHPNKMAQMFNCSNQEAINILRSLEGKGLLTLESTKNKSGNFHQDLRPLRNKLREIVLKEPKIASTSFKKPKIDGSIKVDTSIPQDASTQVDTSIPQVSSSRGGTTKSLREIFDEQKEIRQKKHRNEE